eukprot:c43398_g1_i1 orf=181-780(+)
MVALRGDEGREDDLKGLQREEGVKKWLQVIGLGTLKIRRRNGCSCIRGTRGRKTWKIVDPERNKSQRAVGGSKQDSIFAVAAVSVLGSHGSQDLLYQAEIKRWESRGAQSPGVKGTATQLAANHPNSPANEVMDRRNKEQARCKFNPTTRCEKEMRRWMARKVVTTRMYVRMRSVMGVNHAGSTKRLSIGFLHGWIRRK